MSFYNLLGSIGAFVLALGIILTLVNAAASFNAGAPAGHDPWGGTTLEWFALSPPPPHNFDLVPDVRSNEAYGDIREAVRKRSVRVQLPEAKAEAAETAAVAAAGAPNGPAGGDAEAQGSADGSDGGTLA
jgi:heme/copper-type cytochrome/quinol oxidase subunit 1